MYKFLISNFLTLNSRQSSLFAVSRESMCEHCGGWNACVRESLDPAVIPRVMVLVRFLRRLRDEMKPSRNYCPR